MKKIADVRILFQNALHSEIYLKIKSRSEFAAVIIRANPGWLELVDHAQSRYIGETRVDIA